jgi:F-type H+-transporting ATPase subunit delta
VKKSTAIRRQARRLFRLCLVNGLLDEDRVRQVVQRVLRARPRGYLMLLSHFERLVRLDSANHTADVESAEPLPPELRAHVQTGVEAVYGPGIKTLFAQNPSLIGGMRIKVGSDVYDGSVQARLAALERRF